MPRTTRPFPAMLPALALAACTALPEIEASGLEAAIAAPYPELVPLEQALTSADTPRRLTSEEAAALRARAAALPGSVPSTGPDAPADRVARLRARAEALRGPATTEADIEAMRLRIAALSAAAG